MLTSTLPVRFALEFLGPTSSARATCSSPTIRTTAAATSPTTTSSRRCSSTARWCSSPRSSATTATPAARSPGGYNVTANDIWGEGVRFPAVKIYEKGVERKDITYFMKVNNRTPTFLGDLRARSAPPNSAHRLSEI